MFLLVAHVTVEQGQLIHLPIHRTYIPNKRLRSYDFAAQLKYNALVQQGTYTWIELICVFKSDNPENVCEHRGHLYGTWCDVACFWSWTAVVKVLEHREHVFACLLFLPVAASSWNALYSWHDWADSTRFTPALGGIEVPKRLLQTFDGETCLLFDDDAWQVLPASSCSEWSSESTRWRFNASAYLSLRHWKSSTHVERRVDRLLVVGG